MPTITAVRLGSDERISVNGRLDESAWLRAAPAHDFKQSDPRNGEPASERTEVRVLFDRDTLYIGAEFFDSEPRRLIGNQMVRDGALDGDDRFMWTLDPFFDQRSGYFFEINPSGAMGDAQLVPAPGNTLGVVQNRAWNGIWLARVTRHERGWTAEIEIPFQTINFDPDAPAWGVNFQRTVGRKNEHSFWTGWGRNQGLFALASVGRIEGISGVSQGHGLDIKPYVIGTSAEAPGRGAPHTLTGTGGLDLFYSLTPQLKANVTVNTDFAQTEVDDRQVNLTRFQLFFPEKRDFFLEGSGNFDFSRDPERNISGFFSRRIGLTDAGQPQKIDYGARLFGRAAGFDLGLLQVRTGREHLALGEDFTVFRPKRRFFSQSYAGFLYTRRAARDGAIPDRHTIGADFQIVNTRFRGDETLQFAGYFMKTPTAARRGDDAAFGLRVDYPNDLVNARVFFRSIQKNTDPAVGFVEGNDYRKLTSQFLFRPRPRNHRWVRQVSSGIRTDFYTDTEGAWVERTYALTLLDVNFHSGDRFDVQLTPSWERLHQDLRIGRVTIRRGAEHDFTRYSFGFRTATQRKVSGEANLTNGTFYSGRRRELSGGLSLRPRAGLSASLTSSFNRVELVEGRFSTKLLRAVVNTQFSPWVSISNNVQFDSVSRQLGWQFRLRWIATPGNDIYFVSVANWLDTGEALTALDRSASTKLIYTYRF